ncbi:hypothetical protein HanXRQr2_Chr09g0405351 [Helianthus annuus]|uniref:Transposase (putative) gypsy type domain-containing protein n=1 Tax=Helianthus annuus TaxID=4232 RepID=A0A9K3N9Y6_HELAN|nr:hypothetical protein HanXRQr2_Chr09g0405351 [Helianthus annuus]KAJ0894637.1 hypothetical protein HanPSC8_Chr09g0391271 [Helianthus annuus]
MADKNPTQKKRKNRSRAPPGPDQAVINWKEDEFQMLVRGHNFRPEWGARYPPSGSTALDAPRGFITLYAAYFREGNFRLPITKFTADVLRGYGLHISQINAIGLPRITHFEFVCRSYRVEPTFEMFNTIYSVSYSSGFYSFQARMGVAQVGQGVPRVDVPPNYGDQDWFKKITAKPTAISQLDEMALVGAGMSLLWVPKHPLGQPAYSHKGKFGYSLLNALDPKSAGAMVEAIQADGNPTWLEQIHDRFLHPTDASLSGYAHEVLGEDDEDDLVDSGREEVVILSSGSSDRDVEDLISHSARAGTAPGGVAEPVHGFAEDDDDAEASVDPSAQLETRKRARTEKSVRREEKKEGGAAGSSRKQPSTLPYLDYVVVSDTLSGLGPGEVRQGSDPDDKATLSEHMKKKALDDHKRHLDEQAAALLVAKRAKLQKDAPQPLLNLRLIWVCLVGVEGICWRRYLMPLLPALTGKKPRPVDISQITPPTSPPSRTVGLTPPQDDADASVKGGEGFFEGMFEGGDAAGGDVGGDAGGSRGAGGDIAGADKGKGIEVEMESSETTPQQTVYTKRPPGGGGATSGAVRDSYFERVPDDSWGNPACDDMPHIPRWSLTQGSRMNDLQNCQEFFSLSLPPAERMFQKNRSRFALIDDHVTAGVNFFATSQEILREWRSMGEETMAFEEAKKAFAEEKEKFNAEQKGLQWRVTEAERKLEEQKQLNEQKQKDWESACARTNTEMQSQRDAIVRLSGEKTALAEEAHQARLAAEKKEKEYVARIDKLELLVQEKASECEAAQRLLDGKTAECRASELLAEEASADSRWLLSRGVPLLADRILNSPELARYMFELGGAGYNSGRKNGYAEGRCAAVNNEKDYHFELFKEDCEGAYAAKRREFSMLDFAVVRAAGKLANKANGVALLKKALGEEGGGAAGGAGSSHT